MKLKFTTKIAQISMLLMLVFGMVQVSVAGGLDDKTILAIYDQVNRFDVETAQLGLEKGNSNEVKSLAKMVYNDHSGVRKGVKSLAGELKLSLDLPASRQKAEDEHKAVIAKLKGKSGVDFDKAYLEHEIAFHTAAIQAVREILLPNAKNAKIKEHFNAVLPAFEHHLAMTMVAAKKINEK